MSKTEFVLIPPVIVRETIETAEQLEELAETIIWLGEETSWLTRGKCFVKNGSLRYIRYQPMHGDSVDQVEVDTRIRVGSDIFYRQGSPEKVFGITKKWDYDRDDPVKSFPSWLTQMEMVELKP